MCIHCRPADPRTQRYLITRRQMLTTTLLALGGCAVPALVQARGMLPPRTPRLHPLLQSVPFSGEQAMQHAAAQMAFIPRDPGTEGSRMCGNYILEQLELFGWQTEEQPFTYRDTACRNLIGKRGSGPVLVIGAHYDTRRRADRDSPDLRDMPVPGANDGASGVAVLLELARIIDPEELGRTIWLVFFDAEDNGGLDGWDWIAGSRYMVRNLNTTPQGMVLADMVGDAALNLPYERRSTAALKQAIWQVAADLGYDAFVPEPGYFILDDHVPFLEAGIAAVDIIDLDYDDWHKTTDTLDKIRPGSLEAVGRTIQQWLLLDAPGLPEPPPEPRRVFLPFVRAGA